MSVVADNPGVAPGETKDLAKTTTVTAGEGEMADWAAIMEDEQAELDSQLAEVDALRTETPNDDQDQVDGGEETRYSSMSMDRRSNSRNGPFVVKVNNLPPVAQKEDVFFHFGGEGTVVDINMMKGQAEVEFVNSAAMENAFALDEKYFMGRIIRVLSTNYRPSSYRRQSNRLDSQSSYYSTDSRTRGGERHDRERYRNYDNNYRGNYQGGGGGYRRDEFDQQRMPNPNYIPNKRGGGSGSGPYPDSGYGGGYHNQSYPRGRGGYQDRGGYASGGSSYRGGRGGGGGYNNYNSLPRGGGGYSNREDRQNYYDGSLQRTNSYHQYPKYDRPASSATAYPENQMSDRRSMDISSPPPPVHLVKKPTSKDIFGDAKPVDTWQREQEVEEKLRKEKERMHKEEAERIEAVRRAKLEAEAAANAASEENSAPEHFNGNAAYNHPRHHPNPERTERRPLLETPPQTTSLRQQHNVSPFDGEQGSVAILVRPQKKDDQDAHSDSSPPLDPVHPRPTSVPEQVYRKESTHSHSEAYETEKVRTFSRKSSNQLQKSQTMGTIPDNRDRGSFRGRGGARGGRGTYRGAHSQGGGAVSGAPSGAAAPVTDRRSSYDSQKPTTFQGPRGGGHGKATRKDSASSRGTVDGSFRGARGGHHGSAGAKREQREQEPKDQEQKTVRSFGGPRKVRVFRPTKSHSYSKHMTDGAGGQPRDKSHQSSEKKADAPKQKQQQTAAVVPPVKTETEVPKTVEKKQDKAAVPPVVVKEEVVPKEKEPVEKKSSGGSGQSDNKKNTEEKEKEKKKKKKSTPAPAVVAAKPKVGGAFTNKFATLRNLPPE